MEKLMKHEKNNVVNLLSVLLWGVVAYAIALLTYCTMKYVLSASDGYISAFGSIFGACGAFFAAFVAAYLFNGWRSQKDHDTKTTYLNNAIQSLSEIHMSLIICRSNANNLKTIGSNLILMSGYIESFSKSHNKLLIPIYSNLIVAEKLYGNKNLVDIYNKYDKYIYVFDSYNQELSRRYKTYFYYYIDNYSTDKSKTNISLFRPNSIYKCIPDNTHRINIAEVLNFFTTKLERVMGDKYDLTNYDSHIEECIKQHDIFLDACIKELKAR